MADERAGDPGRDWSPQNDAAMVAPGALTIPPLEGNGVVLDGVVQHVEDSFIDQALRRTRGNRQAAAKLLGMKRTTLVTKLRRRFRNSKLDD